MPRTVFPLLFGRVGLLVGLCLCAGLQGRATPVAFELPEQPASSALIAFAKQAGVEVLFSFDDLKKIRANAVVGRREPEEAIAALLRGSGFRATRNATGRFVVVRERARRQTGEIRGRVVAAATGEPLTGAWIGLAGAPVGVRSRTDGWFLLPEVPAERQVLVVRATGFVGTRILDVLVAPSRRVQLGTVRLAGLGDAEVLEEVVVNASELDDAGALAVVLEEVVVTPSRFGLAEEHGLVAATLTQRDLLALPQLGEDLYRAISHLPGLAADDLTARFWVRGAPHDQVLARLDGVDLIEPFHLKDTDSSLSIIDLEAISSLDLSTGGFGAEYGNRAAGVLTMETDRHMRAQPQTTLGMSLTGVRAASRGQTADGRSRWLVNARSGYPDLAFSAIGQEGDTAIRPRYYDVMGKWETALTPRHRLSLHTLHADDRMFFRDAAGSILRSHYGSDYTWARWQAEVGPLRGETVASLTRVLWERDGSGMVNQRQLAIAAHERRELESVGLRQQWDLAASDAAWLRGGFEVTSGRVDYEYDSLRDTFVVEEGSLRIERRTNAARLSPRGTVVGGFASARLRAGSQLMLEPGMRYDENNYAHDAGIRPRFSAAWARGRSTWRTAWGLYAQSQGLHRLAVQDGATEFSSAERAEHRILSFEHRLRSGVGLRIEGYERLVRRPQPHWENVTGATDAVPELGADRIRIDPARQRARGVELIVERRASETFTWSASYAWARSEETLRDGRVIPRARDQRHTFYLDATYAPNPRWQFCLVWQYHTGWPTTAWEFTSTPLANGSVALFGQLGPLAGHRLPGYARLDLRAQRRFLLKRSTLRVFVDVFNAFGKRNVMNYAYDPHYDAAGRVVTVRSSGDALLPILPSVGVTWEF